MAVQYALANGYASTTTMRNEIPDSSATPLCQYANRILLFKNYWSFLAIVLNKPKYKHPRRINIHNTFIV